MASSSEDSTSSDYCTDSSDEDGMETAHVCGARIQLPHGLCERKDIFDEFFTVELWNSFSDEDKEHLQSFLPNFPENDDLEKTKTLQRLFDFDNFRFSNPLNKFFEHLKCGYYRPDISQMRKMINKAEKKEAKYRKYCFIEQFKNELIESQEKLLNQMKSLPPGAEPKLEKNKQTVDYVFHRTKRRYFQTLASIKAKTDDAEVSPDENYPDGPNPSLSRKQRRHLNSIKNNFNSSKDRIFSSTMAAKLNGFQIDLEKYITPHHNPFYVTDDSYKNMLHQHKKRKIENYSHPELSTSDITITDIVDRTKLPFIKNLQNKSSVSETKAAVRKRPKKEPTKSPIYPVGKLLVQSFANNNNNTSDSESDSDSFIDAVTVPAAPPFSTSKLKVANLPVKTRPISPIKIKEEIKIEPMEEQFDSSTAFTKLQAEPKPSHETITSVNSIMTSSYGKITPIKVEDLETIDIMNTPIELDNSEIDILDLNMKPELMQDTHSNFFSLIRDVICSTHEHRMNMYTLQERLKAWQENPISPLNDWYSYVDNWINILPSAITFLCGNASEQPDDFVPYMEYKPNLDVYQWIGAGRDSDLLLCNLCTFWLQHRTESKLVTPIEMELDIVDRDSSPPPPRCPTTWTVRKATPEEIRVYREQERRRYNIPHKAFTFRCNGYESVVGPLKGIYNPASANTKARGHTMLNADRPNFVTILSLVRDATARLPNGEGTRSEICELLKSSQYISSTAPDNVLQSVVSGALDRMHTQWDPCVKYDQKRKIWIYLHRNRSEDDFERIHQHYQGVQKIKKNARKSPVKPKVPKAEKQPKGKQQSAKAADSQKIVPSEAQANLMQVQHEVVLDPIKEEIVETTVEQVATEPPRLIQTPQQTSVPELITVKTTTTPKPKVVRRQSLLQNKIANIDDRMVVSVPSLVPTSQKSTSLLLNNNTAAKQKQEGASASTQSVMKQPPGKREAVEQDATSELLQIRVASPVGLLKGAAKGQMVKIVSPSQGKSVIIPTSNPQILKQIQEKPLKGQQQQYLHGIHVQYKQKMGTTTTKIVESASEQVKPAVDKLKIPVSAQQQIVQGLTQEQLQNIKNVTLLRANAAGAAQSSVESPQQTISNVVTVAVPKGATHTESVQIKTPSNLTPAQTQQILQTIKQKYLPNANVLTPQQQVLLKQKGGVVQLQKSGAVSKSGADAIINKAPANNAMVAKVLTNSAGQVISVESLLAHQKTHGTLPQGTTLRVQGAKSGQQNIIHLTNTCKQNAIAHFTVGTQNNLVALTTQPKLVIASQTAVPNTVVSSKSLATRTVSTPCVQQLPKGQNVTQHLVNAKLLTSDGQKIVHPKVMVGGQAVKVSSKGGAKMANTGLRMVNNLNLTTIDGKPVLLASKSGTIQNLHGQNVILQAQTPTSSSLVLQSPVATKKAGNTSSTTQVQSSANMNILNQSGNIVFSTTAIKNQLPQQVLLQSKGGAASGNSSPSQGHIVLGGQPIRLQTSNAAGSQRVVLASQGQGGQILAQQILLPAGFQGTAINIKSLQGVKVIPIAQAQAKGGQGRQIFAKVMSPNLVKQPSVQPSAAKLPDNLTTVHSSESE